MNRSRVQLWVPHSFSLQLTYTWSTLSKKLSVLHSTPRLWQRYVDDTFVIQKEVSKQDILPHINSVDLAIQFTVEDNKENGTIPFLDTIVKLEADGNLFITVYRKPTHMDQYLQ